MTPALRDSLIAFAVVALGMIGTVLTAVGGYLAAKIRAHTAAVTTDIASRDAHAADLRANTAATDKQTTAIREAHGLPAKAHHQRK